VSWQDRGELKSENTQAMSNKSDRRDKGGAPPAAQTPRIGD
jgi:hypothetical protein